MIICQRKTCAGTKPSASVRHFATNLIAALSHVFIGLEANLTLILALWGATTGRQRRRSVYHRRMRTTHLLYLHGFRSSPLSVKARQMAAVVEQKHPGVKLVVPAIAAVTACRDGIDPRRRGRLAAGRGLSAHGRGGLFAGRVLTPPWSPSGWACRAVLLNPAVEPARDLARHIGEQTGWQNPAERFFFEPGFVDELRALQPGPASEPRPLPGRDCQRR